MATSHFPDQAAQANEASKWNSLGGGWSFAQRVGFRFAFSFLVLCVFPFPFSTSPASVIPTTFWDRMWFAAAQWLGRHVFHSAPTPEGFANFLLADTNAGYIELLCFVVLAAVTTMVWTLVDRKRTDYRTLQECLRIYVRYALGPADHVSASEVPRREFALDGRPDIRFPALPSGSETSASTR